MKTIFGTTSPALSIYFFGLALFTSCEDFVQADLPDTQLTTPVVFEDKATANAALIAIYAQIRDNGLLSGSPAGLSNQLGLYADELIYYGDIQSVSYNFYNNNLSPSSADLYALWNSSYNQINAANAVLEGARQSESLSHEDRNAIRGEALFIRSLIHFYLAGVYGDIPYIVSTDYQQNRVAEKIPASDVWALAVTDLQEAAMLLPADYTDPERVRPNKFAAKALLSRILLYSERWEEASEEASAVINESIYSLDIPIGEAFLKSSAETIWQLSPALMGSNTLEGSTFLFVSGPPPRVSLSNSLVTSFEPGDLRRENWVGEITDGNLSWYHANKYKLSLQATGAQEYSKIVRLAELYLIRSEARARQGDIIGAGEDLNRVRFRAGLSPTTAASQQELLELVLHERQVELFTEFGHRFFDLKRNARLDDILGTLKPGWDSTDALLPLPATELGLNPGMLPQNPGY